MCYCGILFIFLHAVCCHLINCFILYFGLLTLLLKPWFSHHLMDKHIRIFLFWALLTIFPSIWGCVSMFLGSKDGDGNFRLTIGN